MKNPSATQPPMHGAVVRMWRRGAWVLGLALGLLGGAAQAGLHFAFSVDFVGGPVAGQTAIGKIEVASSDCPAFVCNGLFTPSGPDNFIGPTGTLLGFEIVVDGFTFTAGSDDAHPDFPIFTFSNNVLTGIDFFASGAPGLSIFADASDGGSLSGGGEYRNAFFERSLVAGIQQISVPLPEPATALLVGLALAAGFTASRRSRR